MTRRPLSLCLSSVSLGAGVLESDVASPQTPLLAVALFWLVVTAVASLLVLRLTKGAVVGYQWALGCMVLRGQKARKYEYPPALT